RIFPCCRLVPAPRFTSVIQFTGLPTEEGKCGAQFYRRRPGPRAQVATVLFLSFSNPFRLSTIFELHTQSIWRSPRPIKFEMEATMRMIRTFYIAAALLLLSSSASAITVTGTVKGPDGAPFEGAFIEAQNT